MAATTTASRSMRLPQNVVAVVTDAGCVDPPVIAARFALLLLAIRPTG